MVQNTPKIVSKWVQMDKYGKQKIISNCPKLFLMVSNHQKQLQNGKNWLKIVPYDSEWSQMVPNGLKWSQNNQNSLNLSKWATWYALRPCLIGY